VTAQPTTQATLVGEYRVILKRRGQGIDRYFTVVDPEGRSTEQKVLWTYAMTPFQAAESAVAQHLGHDGWRLAAATRADQVSGHIVTVG
jgi:hypothetical protein